MQWEFWLGNHSPGIKWNLRTCDSSFGSRSLFNSQNRLQRNTQWRRPEHWNLSAVEMWRKCRLGRQTSLREAYSAALKRTRQRTFGSDCSGNTVTNTISNQNNKKGHCCYWDIFRARSQSTSHARAGLMPAMILWGGYNRPIYIRMKKWEPREPEWLDPDLMVWTTLPF